MVLNIEGLAKLLGNAKKLKRINGFNQGFSCICPVHKDSSLWIHNKERDNKIYVTCTRGCSQEAILCELGKVIWGAAL
jgi:hypothetical protein